MSRVISIARSARRRRRARRVLRTLAPAMRWAALLTIAAVAADRGLALGLHPALLALPAALLVPPALIAAALRRDSLTQSSKELDDALALRDRLTTGVAFSESDAGGPFETLARDDAERAAAGLRASQGVPVVHPAEHRWWPVLTAAAVALAVWLPARTITSQGPPPGATTAAEREDAADEIAAIQDELQNEIDAQPELFNQSTQRELEALEALQQELEQPGTDAEAVRAQAAEAVSDAAEELSDQADAAQRAMDATAERFQSDGADPIADALADGDFESAARQLESLQQQLEGATPEQRQEIADRLQELADQIDTDAASETPTSEDDAQALEQQGIDPGRAQELAEQGDAGEIQEALESAGSDPLSAQQSADQIAENAQQRQADQQSQQNAEEMREALQDASESCDNPGEGSGGQSAGGAASSEQDGTPQDQNEPEQGGTGADGSGEGEGEQQPGSGTSPSTQRAADAARRMGQQQQAAREQREMSDRLRQMAQQTVSPPDGGPSQGAGRGDTPTALTSAPPENRNLMTEDVDARQQTESTRTVAEVNAAGPAAAPREQSTTAAHRALEDAAPGAERALENQGVPARFRDLVKRYFRPSTAPTPPASTTGEDSGS